MTGFPDIFLIILDNIEFSDMFLFLLMVYIYTLKKPHCQPIRSSLSTAWLILSFINCALPPKFGPCSGGFPRVGAATPLATWYAHSHLLPLTGFTDLRRPFYGIISSAVRPPRSPARVPLSNRFSGLDWAPTPNWALWASLAICPWSPHGHTPPNPAPVPVTWRSPGFSSNFPFLDLTPDGPILEYGSIINDE